MSSNNDDTIADKLTSAEKAFVKNGLDGFVEHLQTVEDKWRTIPINIALIGNCGVGKSSFINAIRRLTADDDGAAAVGVTETTMEAKAYDHPMNPLMKFWDLPGVGTPKFNPKEYLIKFKLEQYDFFLLITATRFTENDVLLAEEVKKLGKKLFCVRTKIAVDVSNDREAYPRTHNPEKVIKEIRKNTAAMLKEGTPLFLIDSYKIQLYDFTILERRLISDFPELKRSALVLSMKASSEQIVQYKVAELRSRIWICALYSGVVAAVPVPGVSFAFDIGAVQKRIEFYKSQLGLDAESLEKFSRMKFIDSQELKSVMAHPRNNFTVDGIKILAQSVQAVAYSKANGSWRWILPAVAIPVIASPLSFMGTYLLLNSALDQLQETAIKIARLASESMVKLEKDNDDHIRSKY